LSGRHVETHTGDPSITASAIALRTIEPRLTIDQRARHRGVGLLDWG
jgi:hypothetical protein